MQGQPARRTAPRRRGKASSGPRSAGASTASSIRSGRRSRVRPATASRRHRAISAWLPDSSTSGTDPGFVLDRAGVVRAVEQALAPETVLRPDSASFSAPSCSRATASTSTAAASSPPDGRSRRWSSSTSACSRRSSTPSWRPHSSTSRGCEASSRPSPGQSPAPAGGGRPPAGPDPPRARPAVAARSGSTSITIARAAAERAVVDATVGALGEIARVPAVDRQQPALAARPTTPCAAGWATNSGNRLTMSKRMLSPSPSRKAGMGMVLSLRHRHLNTIPRREGLKSASQSTVTTPASKSTLRMWSGSRKESSVRARPRHQHVVRAGGEQVRNGAGVDALDVARAGLRDRPSSTRRRRRRAPNAAPALRFRASPRPHRGLRCRESSPPILRAGAPAHALDAAFAALRVAQDPRLVAGSHLPAR